MGQSAEAGLAFGILPSTPPPPVHLGPTWEISEGWKEGDPIDEKYILPEVTLGYHVLKWMQDNLLDDEGEPFTPSGEQARFVLWFYALDDRGSFSYRQGILQRLKGWGKDPIGAAICAVEFVGPARFSHWQMKDHDPETGTFKYDPVGKCNPRAWVQIAAVTKGQTKNTMEIFSYMFSDKCKEEHGIDLGKEVIYARKGSVKIEVVTSNPRALEGNRPTFVLMNEIHHWLESNKGIKMAAVVRRNIAKSKKLRGAESSSARTLSITNAYDPAEASVAQAERESWEEVNARGIKNTILYDSLEASPEAMLSLPRGDGEPAELYEARLTKYLKGVIDGTKGDSWWLDAGNLVAEILVSKDPSETKRFYFNRIVGSEDVWIAHEAVDLAADPLCVEARSSDRDDALRAGWIIRPEEKIVMFFDGSKSRDTTALIGCRISDGQLFTLGYWERPIDGDGGSRRKWQVDRGEVHARVVEVMGKFNVVAFFGDPSHATDEKDASGWWDGLLDRWHNEYKDRLTLWAVNGGHSLHSISWDMSSPTNQRLFCEGVDRFAAEIQEVDDVEAFAPAFRHDGHPVLMRHLKQARAYPHPKGYGDSIYKGNRNSSRKIDLAVAAVGARLLRRMWLNHDPDANEFVPGRIGGFHG